MPFVMFWGARPLTLDLGFGPSKDLRRLPLKLNLMLAPIPWPVFPSGRMGPPNPLSTLSPVGDTKNRCAFPEKDATKPCMARASAIHDGYTM